MWLFDKLIHRGTGTGIWDDVQISPVVARSIQECLNAFYYEPGWAKKGNMKLSGIPAVITNYISTLATTEMEVNCGTGARADWIMDQVKPLLHNMQRAVQLAAAGGELIIRPYVSGQAIQFDLVQAGRFFPTRIGDNDKVEAGFFCDYYDCSKGKFLRIESFDYSNGVLSIINKAYRNRGDVLSAEIPLTSVDKWAHLKPEFTVNNVSGPLFGAIRMPFANTVDDTSPLPISLYANALDNIKEFDTLYTEFLYELHSGKRKRIVERNAIVPRARDKTPGAIPVGVTYKDMTTDTYLIIDPDEQSKPFDDYTPAIRSSDYLTGLKTVLAMVENQCYLSPGTLAIDDRTGAVTATQVISDDRTTYNTCNAIQQQGIAEGMLDAIRACDAMAELHHLAPAGDIEPSVSFGDSVFEDTAQEFARQMAMVQAGCLKPEKLLSWYFEVDEDTAIAEYMATQQNNDEGFENLLGGA
ncbi:MAG: phage portal protein [Clostridia bacterium]|nr:phage portal protein [Clostridia bacterium]